MTRDKVTHTDQHCHQVELPDPTVLGRRATSEVRSHIAEPKDDSEN